MAADRRTWLGHAAVLLELGGARFVTDPVLRARVAHLRREVPRPAPIGRLDGVLISHGHHDHLHLSTTGPDDLSAAVCPRAAQATSPRTGELVSAHARATGRLLNIQVRRPMLR